LPISYHLLSQILHCDFKAFFPPSWPSRYSLETTHLS
jgi:hypothetical protein